MKLASKEDVLSRLQARASGTGTFKSTTRKMATVPGHRNVRFQEPILRPSRSTRDLVLLPRLVPPERYGGTSNPRDKVGKPGVLRPADARMFDDDESICDSLRDLIESAGLVARCFGSAEEFLKSGLHCQPACLITDILMPKMSGLELQTKLKDEECDIPVIFITAYVDASMRIQAMREGAVEFLAKPFDHHMLLKTLRAALDM